MDLAILRQAMKETYVSNETLAEYLPHFEEAMRAAEITTARRAAAWCSQIGHESAGLKYMAEIQKSDPSWSWDRTRYRGRGPIQLTWQANYAKFGAWCQSRGYTTDADLFVKQPELVEQPRWGFLAASWYWLNGGPRPGEINAFADAGDIVSVTKCINGWVPESRLYGLPDRKARWNQCLLIGESLLPTGELMAISNEDATRVVGAALQTGTAHQDNGAKHPDDRTYGPRPLRHPDLYNVAGNEGLRKAGKKLAYLRAMVMDIWNEVAFDGYVAEVADPRLDEGKFGSLVGFVLAAHANAREANLVSQRLAASLGVDVSDIVKGA